MLEHYMLNAPAWQALSANAKVVYIEMKGRFNGHNNGMLKLSAREAGNALNASKDTGARALKELVEHGFIAVTENSSFSRKMQIARSYRLTEHASDLPQEPGESRLASKEFTRWRPEPSTKMQKPVASVGRHGPIYRSPSSKTG